MSDERKEELKVKGEELVNKVKELVHQGNIRRIVIKNAHGKKVFEIPLTFGVVGAMFAPIWATIGAFAVLAADYKIEVVKDSEDADPFDKTSSEEGAGL